MKNKSLLTAFAVIGLAGATISCSKDNAVNQPSGITEAQRVELTFGIGTGRTKAATAMTDDNVASLKVYVFNPDGTIDVSGASTTSSVTLKPTVGTGKQIYALVNSPDIGTVYLLSDLTAKTSNLADNATSNFVMQGHVTMEINSSTSSVMVPVSRIASMVEIDKITNSITEPAYSGYPIIVKKMYLINVPSDAPTYFSPDSYTPTTWVNMQSYSASALDAFTYEALTDVQISNTGNYSTPHYFYSYPNPTSADSQATTWGARKTRLVIETTIRGTTFYYPVTLDELKANTRYLITDLNITRIGSSNPDAPVTTQQATFTVTVTDWTTVSNTEEI